MPICRQNWRLAPIVVEILLRKTLFHAKKKGTSGSSFFQQNVVTKKIIMDSPNSFLKNYSFALILFLMIPFKMTVSRMIAEPI